MIDFQLITTTLVFNSNVRETWRVILVSEADIFQSCVSTEHNSSSFFISNISRLFR